VEGKGSCQDGVSSDSIWINGEFTLSAPSSGNKGKTQSAGEKVEFTSSDSRKISQKDYYTITFPETADSASRSSSALTTTAKTTQHGSNQRLYGSFDRRNC